MHEESLFEAALERTSPAERQAFLDEACAGRPEMRRQVEDLLRLNDAAEPVSFALLNKHFNRKHGPGAYYGQLDERG